jgi:hypothetical protein
MSSAELNLVLITAMIRPITSKTVFTSEERFNQLITTIGSVQAKIPNSKIALVEGGTISDEEITRIRPKVDVIIVADVSHLLKSPGETMLIHSYFQSKHYESHKDQITNLVKISGRYYLDRKFKWSRFPKDKTIAVYCDRDKSWSRHAYFNTRFYKIPQSKIPQFIDGIKTRTCHPDFNQPFPDIEHCMVIYNMLDRTNVHHLPYIGVRGFYGENGTVISD